MEKGDASQKEGIGELKGSVFVGKSELGGANGDGGRTWKGGVTREKTEWSFLEGWETRTDISILL